MIFRGVILILWESYCAPIIEYRPLGEYPAFGRYFQLYSLGDSSAAAFRYQCRSNLLVVTPQYYDERVSLRVCLFASISPELFF